MPATITTAAYTTRTRLCGTWGGMAALLSQGLQAPSQASSDHSAVVLHELPPGLLRAGS